MPRSPITFGAACAPPVLGQHHALDAALEKGPTSLTLFPCGMGDAHLSSAVRARWLKAIHPNLVVLAPGAGFGDTVRGRPLFGDREGRLAASDPVSAWSALHPIVQGALTVRVCVVGAESTGKSTLVRALSARHRTSGVGEYGRDYTIAKKDAGTNDHWTTDDFVAIAREQQRLEDELAIGAGPLFFCDTDAMTTGLWHERYQGSRSDEVDRLGRMRTYDLFVLCDTDIPWEQDEIRLGAETRTAMHERFVDVLTSDRTEPWVLVSGDVDERMALVDSEILRLGLLRAAAMYAPTRHHLQ